MPEQEGLENLSWFWKLVQSVLRSHAKNANLEFFQHKYPGLPAEIIAARLIDTAAKFAGLVGFVSGGIISVASLTALTSIVGTVATGLVGSPVTVPALAVSLPLIGVALTAEVGLLIRIQLHLAYDLFVLHGLPVDVEDPERMQEVMQVAFGIKGVEVSGQAIQKIIAQFAPQMLRKAMRTGLVRRKIQEIVAKIPRILTNLVGNTPSIKTGLGQSSATICYIAVYDDYFLCQIIETATRITKMNIVCTSMLRTQTGLLS